MHTSRESGAGEGASNANGSSGSSAAREEHPSSASVVGLWGPLGAAGCWGAAAASTYATQIRIHFNQDTLTFTTHGTPSRLDQETPSARPSNEWTNYSLSKMACCRMQTFEMQDQRCSLTWRVVVGVSVAPAADGASTVGAGGHVPLVEGSAACLAAKSGKLSSTAEAHATPRRGSWGDVKAEEG